MSCDVTFRISAQTAFGENVYVVGDSTLLGCWNLDRALLAHTSRETYPIWSAQVSFLVERNVHFKYVIRNGAGAAIWESMQQDRSVSLQPNTVITLNSEFNNRVVQETVEAKSIEGKTLEEEVKGVTFDRRLDSTTSSVPSLSDVGNSAWQETALVYQMTLPAFYDRRVAEESIPAALGNRIPSHQVFTSSLPIPPNLGQGTWWDNPNAHSVFLGNCLPETALSKDEKREPAASQSKAHEGQCLRERTLSSRERAAEKIAGLAKQMDLPAALAERAIEIYSKVMDTVNLKNVAFAKKDGVIAACIFASCRQEGLPRTFKEICSAAAISKREIGRCYKLIVHVVEPSGGHQPRHKASTDDFMTRFCSKLHMSPRFLACASHVAKMATELDIVQGKGPLTVTAAAIHLVSKCGNEKRPLKKIADVAGVAELTIRNCFKDMAVQCDKLLPVGWERDSPGLGAPQEDVLEADSRSKCLGDDVTCPGSPADLGDDELLQLHLNALESSSSSFLHVSSAGPSSSGATSEMTTSVPGSPSHHDHRLSETHLGPVVVELLNFDMDPFTKTIQHSSPSSASPSSPPARALQSEEGLPKAGWKPVAGGRPFNPHVHGTESASAAHSSEGRVQISRSNAPLSACPVQMDYPQQSHVDQVEASFHEPDRYAPRFAQHMASAHDFLHDLADIDNFGGKFSSIGSFQNLLSLAIRKTSSSSNLPTICESV
mmetsp:Transcript_1170/g.2056  ORF Transcript_1170/g.2056 Transcript_1170/m.2056 type:complete len:716 (+) Transcript_1170:220-2367(+)